MLAYITEVPPGQGVQDYETYLVRLSRMKWPRTLLLEHFPAKEYPPAKRFIEETAARIGVKIYG
jgi:sugar phosphate isomerase/epimerase